MMKLIERILGLERVTVTEGARMLVLGKGRFDAILGPGEYLLKRRNTQREAHILADLRFSSVYADALWRERPDLAEAHLTRIEACEAETLLVLRDGRPEMVIGPKERETFWTDAGPWTVERIALTERLEVPGALARRLAPMGLRAPVKVTIVPEGHVGLLTVDGAPVGRVETGRHTFWDLPGRKVVVRLIDTRLRLHEVSGQEILTKDRVTIRVNLTAGFGVIGPERAVASVGDFEEALHRALQLAFRRTMGAMTLDRLLAEKVSVDAGAAEKVRAEIATIGVEVGEIALKDVILPGEMREILNRVVAAEKEAEANVIRRREETNATRSLLNTAKVMAENPVMLRLKELEALETIAGKVERLTVHNGTDGLMTDLVRLRD